MALAAEILPRQLGAMNVDSRDGRTACGECLLQMCEEREGSPEFTVRFENAACEINGSVIRHNHVLLRKRRAGTCTTAGARVVQPVFRALTAICHSRHRTTQHLPSAVVLVYCRNDARMFSRWIRRRGRTQCPPRSPALTSFYFYLWGCQKHCTTRGTTLNVPVPLCHHCTLQSVACCEQSFDVCGAKVTNV
jgi:hypothetical protein